METKKNYRKPEFEEIKIEMTQALCDSAESGDLT
jgi:hypothetical protein